MSRKRIATSNDSAVIFVPKEVLDEMGICEGDEVDVSFLDGTLFVRSITELDRAKSIEDATNAVFERRQTAYTKLAEGPE